MADQIPGWIGWSADGTGWRRQHSGDGFKRAIEAVEYPVELHAHLHGESPARDVIGPVGRAAGIREIVGVILRLKHIHPVPPESLRGLHDVGARGIVLARYLE